MTKDAETNLTRRARMELESRRINRFGIFLTSGLLIGTITGIILDIVVGGTIGPLFPGLGTIVGTIIGGIVGIVDFMRSNNHSEL